MAAGAVLGLEDDFVGLEVGVAGLEGDFVGLEGVALSAVGVVRGPENNNSRF